MLGVFLVVFEVLPLEGRATLNPVQQVTVRTCARVSQETLAIVDHPDKARAPSCQRTSYNHQLVQSTGVRTVCSRLPRVLDPVFDHQRCDTGPIRRRSGIIQNKDLWKDPRRFARFFGGWPALDGMPGSFSGPSIGRKTARPGEHSPRRSDVGAGRNESSTVHSISAE